MSVSSVIMEEDKIIKDDMLIAIEYLKLFKDKTLSWDNLENKDKGIYRASVETIASFNIEKVVAEYFDNIPQEVIDNNYESYCESHEGSYTYDEVVNHTDYNFDDDEVVDYICENIIDCSTSAEKINLIDGDWLENYVLENYVLESD